MYSRVPWRPLCTLLTFCMLAGCAPSVPCPTPKPEPEPPEEIVNFSDDYAAGRLYRIVGSDLDLDTMGSYPQYIDGEPEPIGFQDNSLDIYLVVKNQSYSGLSPVAIEGQLYPLTVQPFLEETEATAYSGALVSQFAAELEGDDVMTYATNATEAVSKALTYDFEMAQRFNSGSNKWESAENSLETGRGCCGEFSHLLIAVLRYKGIPARLVTGVICDETKKFGISGKHAWVEFYLQGYGWIPVEPQEKIGVPDTYIKLYTGKDYPDTRVPMLLFKLSKVTYLGMYTKRTTNKT